MDLSDVNEETTLQLQMELERAELGKRMAEKRLLKLMRLLERVRARTRMRVRCHGDSGVFTLLATAHTDV